MRDCQSLVDRSMPTTAGSQATDMDERAIWRKGLAGQDDSMMIEGQTFVVSGTVVKTAGLRRDKEEWLEDVHDPDAIIRGLKAAPVRVDMLRFWQRIPDTEVKHAYYHELRHVAAIAITDYKTWWENQVNANTRRLVRKCAKLGVKVGHAEFDDQLVLGIMEIFNESPIRRGKPFRHYQKSFEAVKKEMAADLDKSMFITAHYGDELIGFIKLLFTDKYAMLTMILDKKSHQDKSPVNGLVAETVKICAELKVPFLTYTLWRRGGHGYFQERNGFQPISVPEYYVPITLRGKIALRLGFHKGFRGMIPETLMSRLLAVRARLYALRQSKGSP